MKTILVIRSSGGEHCLRMFAHLREIHHQDPETRWILIAQSEVGKFFSDGLGHLNLTILNYDLPAFTYERLNRAYGDQLRREKIDAAYVPFNNPEGKGYLDIVRFLSGLHPGKIAAYTPKGDLERITLNRFLIQRFILSVFKTSEWVFLTVSLPLVAAYYLVQGGWNWMRRRWPRKKPATTIQPPNPARWLSYDGLRESLEILPRHWHYRYLHEKDLSEKARDTLAILRRDGIVLLPDFVPPKIVAEMRQVVDDSVRQGRFLYDGGKIAFDEPPANPAQIARLNVLDVTLHSRQVIDFALNDLLVAVANAHLGLECFLSGIVAYRTQPTSASPNGAFLWHYDNTPLQLKAMCYLTEVTAGDGPLTYVKGTHRRRPQASTYEETRMDEEKVPMEGRVDCVGKPGTVILIDTNGIHRATPNIRGHRDVVAAIYDAGIRRRRPCFYNLPVPSQFITQLSETQRRMLRVPELSG